MKIEIEINSVKINPINLGILILSFALFYLLTFLQQLPFLFISTIYPICVLIMLMSLFLRNKISDFFKLLTFFIGSYFGTIACIFFHFVYWPGGNFHTPYLLSLSLIALFVALLCGFLNVMHKEGKRLLFLITTTFMVGLSVGALCFVWVIWKLSKSVG